MRFASIIVLALFSTPLFANISVKTSADSFNPTLRNAVRYEITIDRAGLLTAQILDRDTYVAKTLANAQQVAPGLVSLTWDGSDEQGRIVPDEAWSLRVELTTPAGVETYFPAGAHAAMQPVKPDFFDVRTGVLGYTLAVASRVHLQAGYRDVKRSDPTAGAVLKTIVNRSPRPAGAVVEQWTGMDESGSIYVPVLKNFVVAIAATPLPENSVITYGNRERDFIASISDRRGTPVIAVAPAAHHHGLTTLDDIAPSLELRPKNATWRAEGKKWVTPSNLLELTVQPAGPTAAHFERHPGRLIVYVDDQRVIDQTAGRSRFTVALPRNTADHIVAVNWISAYGPVAATALRVQRTR